MTEAQRHRAGLSCENELSTESTNAQHHEESDSEDEDDS